MYEYIKGYVTIIDPSFIVLDNHGLGYLIYVANPYSYQVNNEYQVYVYQQVKEDDQLLYGFKSKEEKDLFLKLISVKGLGPKMAIILLSSSINNIYSAINNEDVVYLKKFPKIGEKLAKQIILDLKGKLAIDKDNSKDIELIQVLENLGYKKDIIKKIVNNIDNNLTLENKIKQALKLLAK